MSSKNSRPLTSRELLARIGLDEDAPGNLLSEEDLIDTTLEDLSGALRQRYEAMTSRQTFRPGDIVTWKPGLKNRRLPSYGKPAIVMEVLDPPIFDSERNSGDGYFREPLDIALGVFIEDGPHRGDFITWHFDSRRLAPFTGARS